MPATSKAQAGYLGAVLAGRARGAGQPSKAVAREMLTGTKVKSLPKKAKKKKTGSGKHMMPNGKMMSDKDMKKKPAKKGY